MAEMGSRLEGVIPNETESGSPLHETEWFRNLAWSDFLDVAAQVKPLLERNTIRLGIVGDPNRSKSLMAWDFYQLALAAGLPAYHCDLDLWSPSRGVFEGLNTWENRPKRKRGEVTDEEIRNSINGLSDLGPGLVVVDFPGLVDEPSQLDRLRAVNLALILENGPEEGIKWLMPLITTRTPFAWMTTSPGLGVEEIEGIRGGHSVYGIDRNIDRIHISEVVALTMMLEWVGSGQSDARPNEDLTYREVEVLRDYREQFGPITAEDSTLKAKITFKPFSFRPYGSRMWRETIIHKIAQLYLSLYGRTWMTDKKQDDLDGYK